jgi:hypothetical protein
MVDTLTGIPMISAYTRSVVIVKFVIDAGLLCFYGLGIGFLLFIGVTGWLAHKASDGINNGVESLITAKTKTTETMGSVITGGTDILKTTYTVAMPKVQTFYGNSKTFFGGLYARFRQRFPKIGRFLDNFFESYS